MSQHFSTIISIHYRVAATLWLAGLTLSGNLGRLFACAETWYVDS